MNQRHERLQIWVQNHPRTVGAILVALGAFLFYWGAYGPYLEALAHGDSIRVGTMGPSLLRPLCFLLGLVFMIFGPKALSWNSKLDPSPTTRNKWLTAIVIIACWAVLAAPYCAIVGRIEALGYRVKGNPVYFVYTKLPPLHKLAEVVDRFIP